MAEKGSENSAGDMARAYNENLFRNRELQFPDYQIPRLPANTANFGNPSPYHQQSEFWNEEDVAQNLEFMADMIHRDANETLAALGRMAAKIAPEPSGDLNLLEQFGHGEILPEISHEEVVEEVQEEVQEEAPVQPKKTRGRPRKHALQELPDPERESSPQKNPKRMTRSVSAANKKSAPPSSTRGKDMDKLSAVLSRKDKPHQSVANPSPVASTSSRSETEKPSILRQLLQSKTPASMMRQISAPPMLDTNRGTTIFLPPSLLSAELDSTGNYRGVQGPMLAGPGNEGSLTPKMIPFDELKNVFLVQAERGEPGFVQFVKYVKEQGKYITPQICVLENGETLADRISIIVGSFGGEGGNPVTPSTPFASGRSAIGQLDQTEFYELDPGNLLLVSTHFVTQWCRVQKEHVLKFVSVGMGPQRLFFDVTHPDKKLFIAKLQGTKSSVKISAIELVEKVEDVGPIGTSLVLQMPSGLRAEPYSVSAVLYGPNGTELLVRTPSGVFKHSVDADGSVWTRTSFSNGNPDSEGKLKMYPGGNMVLREQR